MNNMNSDSWWLLAGSAAQLYITPAGQADLRNNEGQTLHTEVLCDPWAITDEEKRALGESYERDGLVED